MKTTEIFEIIKDFNIHIHVLDNPILSLKSNTVIFVIIFRKYCIEHEYV